MIRGAHAHQTAGVRHRASGIRYPPCGAVSADAAGLPILPGLVQTPLTRRHFDNPDALAAFVARIPMGRPAQPEEIAALVHFLVDGPGGITGETIRMDNGLHLNG